MPDLRALLSGLAWLLELEAGGPAAVVGWSFGALLGQLLAAARPELVTRLGLLHAAGVGDDAKPGHDQLPRLLARIEAELQRERAADGASVLAELSATMDNSALLHYAALILEAAGPASRLVPSQPTLVLAGEHDTLAPPEAARSFAASRPSAQLEVLDSGHFSPLLAPAEVADTLVRWWSC